VVLYGFHKSGLVIVPSFLASIEYNELELVSKRMSCTSIGNGNAVDLG
jgi:hypothetical protein